MSTNGASLDQPAVVRRLEGASASFLGELVETFEELQMTLRCCERLVTELAADAPDPIVVEAVWTTALLSYARCFAESEHSGRVKTDDLTASTPEGDVLEWHEVLMRLRDHYADPGSNPRERFTVAVTQDDDGSASGVAITSARQPLVDDLTVRQTGAIAYALSGVVNERIEAQQQVVSAELEATPRSALEKLDRVEIAATGPGA